MINFWKCLWALYYLMKFSSFIIRGEFIQDEFFIFPIIFPFYRSGNQGSEKLRDIAFPTVPISLPKGVTPASNLDFLSPSLWQSVIS